MNGLLLLLVSSTLKATVILALAALIAWLMRHRTAASRHLVWTAALGSVTAVLAFAIVLPAWRVIRIPAVLVATDATPLLTPHASPAQYSVTAPAWPVSPASPASPARAEPSLPSSTPAWPARILLIWVIGAALVVCRDIVGRITLHRLGRSSSRHVESAEVVSQLAREMGIRRRVSVSCSDDVELPMTWGVFRARIVLPGDVTSWSPACRRHVLQHELAHVSRGDTATQLIAQAATALFWFHPLLWFAVARMRAERERACDDRVLACGAVASAYASDLLTFVGQHGFIEPGTIALGFAERSKFEQRLEALLDPSVARGVLSPARVALVVAFATVIVVPLAAMQHAIDRSPPLPTTLAPVVAVAPAAAPRPRTVPVASRSASEGARSGAVVAGTSDAFEGCALRVTSEHSHDVTDGDRSTGWTATAGNDGCQYSLVSAGTILLNGDATAVDQISAGGYLDLSMSIHGDVTRLVARASADWQTSATTSATTASPSTSRLQVVRGSSAFCFAWTGRRRLRLSVASRCCSAPADQPVCWLKSNGCIPTTPCRST